MRKRLFSSQRYQQKQNEIIPPKLKKGRCEWIVSRALCHYRLFSLADIPIAHRDTVLGLKIRQWCPFQEYGSYIVWQKNEAQVWVWDQSRQQSAQLEANIKSARIFPESIMRPRLTDEGVQFLKCLEGIEAQVWKNGRLSTSHWWSNLPSQAEWEIFQRAQGLTVTPELPEVVDSPLLTKAWGKSKTGLSQFDLRNEPLWIFLGASIFVILLSWQLVTLYKWDEATKQIQYQIENLNEKAYPILNARNKAIADKRRAEDLYALNAYPSQLEIMATVTDILNSLRQSPRFIEWHYQIGSLRFIFETSSEILNSSAYVEKFQSVPFFREVKPPEQGNRRNQFSMTIKVVANPLK